MSGSEQIKAMEESRRILVVDDEEIVLVALREALRREKFDVVATSDATLALEYLRKENFAVILTDQQMPVLSGLELLAQAKQMQPHATRILITAVLSLDTVIDAINKGEIYRFIVKPWLHEELIVTVKNAMQRYDLIRHNERLQAETMGMNERLLKLNQSLDQQVKLVAQQNDELSRLNQALEENLGRSVQLCLETIQTFYPTLGSQARRVNQLCRAIAESLHLTTQERQTLDISSLLHDVGLVGVPRRIIRKWQMEPESLSEPERILIEQHPVLGQELTSFAHHLKDVGAVIRAHHERFDGEGYPDHLERDKIPWLARLLSVAVHYAASNLPASAVVEDIKHLSGVAFDPEAVRAFLRALPKATMPRKEKEVLMAELQPGMIISRGIYTANGLLLIPEGQLLTATNIEKILNHNRIYPITQTLVVYC
jgi:response regulator RpfG family c-di-GMP phosphodiesterase